MKKIPPSWIWIIKILVIVCSYGYIYYQLFYQEKHFSELKTNIQDFNSVSLFLLVLTFFLMILNWSLESFKWQLLVKPLEEISFFKSFQGVLIGLTTSIFTPNRTGEYFGRIWVLQSKRTQGILATIVGSIAQIFTTLVAGIIALLSISNNIIETMPKVASNKQLILYSSIIIIILILFFLLLFPRLIKRLKQFRKIYIFLSFISQYSLLNMLKILLFSIARYVIFILQFYILIRIFNITLSIHETFIALSLVYLIMAFVPSFTIAEIGIRGSIAITIFSIFTRETTGIFLAISLLWIINIAIPAIIGSFSLVNLKIRLNASK